MTYPLNLRQLLEWLGDEPYVFDVSSLEERTLRSIAIDSRSVQEGDMFIALQGEKVDGHSFLKQAYDNGAKVALVQESYKGPNFGLALIKVHNPLLALQRMAKNKLAQLRPTVIAVTGSVGKTTTKEFIYTLMRKTYPVTASPGNNNSQIGLATSILNHFKGDEKFLILEMGLSAPGHIRKLVDIAPPDVAVITQIALVHAAQFPEGLKQIALAKAEILSHPQTHLAFINYHAAELELIQQIGNSLKKTYSISDNRADYLLKRTEGNLTFSFNESVYQLPSIELMATHFYENLLAALAVASSCGVSLEDLTQQISQICIPKGRLQRSMIKGIEFLEDTYNAAEISLKGALDCIHKHPAKGRKIAVIGQMLDLGVFSEQCHHRVAEHALNCVDEMVCLGKDCKPIVDLWISLGRKVNWFLEYRDLFEFLKDDLKEGDLVLLKGSRANCLERIIKDFSAIDV